MTEAIQKVEELPASNAMEMRPEMALMRLAIERGTENLESIANFLKMNKEEANESAFAEAIVGFQSECKIVEKGDSANGRAYARMDRIWRQVRPLMEKYSLGVTWNSVKTVGDVVILDGLLVYGDANTHLHFAQPLHHEIPLPDKIPGQNAAQRAGSGEAYAKRYATCAALGIQTGVDDDGNGGLSEATIDAAQLADLRELCEATGTKESLVTTWAGVKALADLPVLKYSEARATLQKKAVRK